MSRSILPAFFCFAILVAPARAAGAYFPIGIYEVNDASSLTTIAAAGFNAAQIPRDPAKFKDFAAAARKAGVKLAVWPQELMTSSAAFDNSSIAAWYLADEPDVNHMKPEALAELDRKVRAWSPNIPTAFVMGAGGAAKTFAASGNILLVDWYPVPHLPLSSAGDQVRMTVDAAGGKPVWAVLQAMDWKDYPQRDAKRPRIGRFPNISELRFMSYDAVLQGASGLWYYTFTQPDGRTLAQVPELWFALTWVVRELSQMAPVFASGAEIAPPFKTDDAGVSARAWSYRGRDYVVVANRSKDAMARMPDVMLSGDWRPLFEPHRDVRLLLAPKGTDGWYLRPYQVMVFESGIRWGRLFGQ